MSVARGKGICCMLSVFLSCILMPCSEEMIHRVAGGFERERD